jgi:protein tyrosine kinase modulator
MVQMSALAAEPSKGTGLERMQAIWSRRKWLALVGFVVPFSAAASVILCVPNLYRSTATVLVDRQQVPESFVKSTVTSELETRLQTISQEILSRAKLEGVISRFGLYRDLQKQASGEEVVERMRRDISLTIKSSDARGRQSPTIAFALGYRGRDPQTVALVTNTLASFYIEENLKARERQASGTTEFLRAQLAETRKRLDDQERRVSEFKRRYLGELPQQMPANLQTLEVLNTQLRLTSDNQVRAAERRLALSAQLAEAESLPQPSAAAQAVVVPGTAAPGPEPPSLHLARLRQELTSARTRYTDAHPTVTRLREEIAAVEAELASARPAETRPETTSEPPAATPRAAPSQYVLKLREALQTAEGEVKILNLEERRLRAAIASYQVRLENTPRREQESLDISRDYEATKEAHQSLVKRYEEAQLAESMEQRQKGEQFRILDPAVPSAVTAAPKRGRLLLVALTLSLALAAAAVMLREMIDTSFHSADDLRAFTAAPLLVSISLITTAADAGRRRWRFRLAVLGAALGLTLVVGASYFIAHGNEELVRALDQDRGSQT